MKMDNVQKIAPLHSQYNEAVYTHKEALRSRSVRGVLLRGTMRYRDGSRGPCQLSLHTYNKLNNAHMAYAGEGDYEGVK